ncbi:hypothetical protein, partial [Caulobacter sp.]|uniref:hypothetical protein n=1 Tax=Caulobacter sp. TaxID=78 RepID=UPI001AFDB669
MKPISPARLRRHLDRLQQSLPAALLRRFVEADLMTQAASLSFYTLLSLAPLLVLLPVYNEAPGPVFARLA